MGHLGDSEVFACLPGMGRKGNPDRIVFPIDYPAIVAGVQHPVALDISIPDVSL